MGEGGNISLPLFNSLLNGSRWLSMKMGMSANDLPDPLNHQSQPAEQRQVIRTKTLGRTEGDPPGQNYKKIAGKIARQEAQNKSDDRAEEVKAKILDKASEMRHLKYEVIEDADIVQISVVSSADGTIVRKVPPDKIVSFIRKVREKDSERKRKLDIKA